MRIPKKERRNMSEMPDGSFVMEEPCRFLVSGRCTIHRSKPGVCKEYPVSYHKESPWVIIIACPAGRELINACLELKPGVKAALYQK
jgi:Fe-S-cluster containining protein